MHIKQFIAGLSLAALAFSSPAMAQVSADDLIVNGSQYGTVKGTAPHFLTQPVVFSDGGNGSFQLNGDFGLGGRYGRANSTNRATAFADGSLSGTFLQTNQRGWTVGGKIAFSGSVSYTLDTTDPLSYDASPDNLTAYGFVDTPGLDVAVGRFSPKTIETSGRATLNGVASPSEIGFSSGVGGDLAASVGTRQGPWELTASADIENRQYAALNWRRPVRTITPAYGVEFIRDGDFDFAATPLTGGLAVGQGQMYGGRAGAMLEYGRLTFGASAGLEAFYDGGSLIEAQSMYDLGVSNKTGRFIYGVSAQHRRSHQAPMHSTSVAADMTIAIATGVDLELGYEFKRTDDAAALAPEYSHSAVADVRVSF